MAKKEVQTIERKRKGFIVLKAFILVALKLDPQS